MSAIFGLLRRADHAVDADELARMQRSLQHRGPDGQACVALGQVGLGHCLLRVNREDRYEIQPLHDRQACVTLTADLRLDNREELAEELGIAAEELARMPDSAVLLKAWSAWQQHCFGRLLGDFAIALWDHRSERLYLARDGMGQRGLYLHQSEGVVAFASEIKALWAVPDVPRALDPVGLARRLLGPVDPAPDTTLFRRIAVLPGGTVRWFDRSGGSGEEQFWRPQPAPQHRDRDPAYYLATYRAVVEEAIACRLRRLESPPLLLFSGGFDSGTIAALGAPIARKQGRAMIAVASLLPPGEERPLGDAARAVGAFAGTPGLEIEPWWRAGQSVFSDLEKGFAQLDECQPHDYFRRAAYALGRNRGARLALDGHGGDYTVNHLDSGMLGRVLLSGNPMRFLRELRARRRLTGQGLVRTLVYEVVRPLLPTAMLRAGSVLLGGARPLWRQRMARDDFVAPLIGRGLIDPARLRDHRVGHGRWQGRWLHMLEKAAASGPGANTLAAAEGLDFTRPFHDLRVVELGLAIPAELQFRDGRERWLARQALADVLPGALIASGPGNAPERPGLHAMLAEALPGALNELGRAGPDCPACDYVDLDKVRAALEQGMAGDTSMINHLALNAAANGVVVARFVNWFDRRNRRSQEP